jgi:hypothetical protein
LQYDFHSNPFLIYKIFNHIGYIQRARRADFLVSFPL